MQLASAPSNSWSTRLMVNTVLQADPTLDSTTVHVDWQQGQQSENPLHTDIAWLDLGPGMPLDNSPSRSSSPTRMQAADDLYLPRCAPPPPAHTSSAWTPPHFQCRACTWHKPVLCRGVKLRGELSVKSRLHWLASWLNQQLACVFKCSQPGVCFLFVPARLTEHAESLATWLTAAGGRASTCAARAETDGGTHTTAPDRPAPPDRPERRRNAWSAAWQRTGQRLLHPGENVHAYVLRWRPC